MSVVKQIDTRSYSAISRIINNLQAVPGRKAVMLFSDNDPPMHEAPQSFGDQGLRSSTTVYQCAPPGWRLTWGDFSSDTGGYALKAKEDGFSEIEQVLNDFDRCYLLGFKPDSKTLESLQEINSQSGTPQRIVTNTHSLRIRLKELGLKVRTRSGFTDISLRNTSPFPIGSSHARSPRTILSSSPFFTGNLEVTATALPFYNAKKETVIRAVLHIDGTHLRFKAEPEDGYRIADVSIMGQAYLDGKMVNSYKGTGAFRAPVKDFTNRISRGFVSTFDVPVPGPGSYELRTTITQGGGLGNVSLLTEVPNFAGSDLVTSGIATFNVEDSDKTGEAAATTRIIRRSEPFACSLFVYNARRQSGKSQIEGQVRLYRNDTLVKASDIVVVSSQNADPASNQIPVRFEMNPSSELTAGNYLLEIVVVDRLAGKKHGSAAPSVAIELAD
jgi:hypothetical protein